MIMTAVRGKNEYVNYITSLITVVDKVVIELESKGSEDFSGQIRGIFSVGLDTVITRKMGKSSLAFGQNHCPCLERK